jgi:hypothetical protein
MNLKKGDLLTCHTSYYSGNRQLLTKGNVYKIVEYERRVSCSNFDEGCDVFRVNTNISNVICLEFVKEEGDYKHYLTTDLEIRKMKLTKLRKVKLLKLY